MRNLLALALLAWLAAVPAALAADRPPNIVLLIVDDLGYADVGVQGLRGIPTPHLDTIARTGVRLTAGYVAAPVCSPSRAAIMTGRYPQRFGIYDNAPTSTSDPRFGLPRGQPTLAERLRALGYRTALFGKWHLGSPAWQRPNARGFEETLTFLNSGGHRYFGTPAQPNLLYRGDRVVAEPDYLTFAFAREAVSFIHRSADAPFFLAVPFSAVHPPQEAPADYIARFAAIGDKKRRLMAAMLSTLDDATGRILAALREEGLNRARSSSSSATMAAIPPRTPRATIPSRAPRATCSRAASACRSSCAGRATCRRVRSMTGRSPASTSRPRRWPLPATASVPCQRSTGSISCPT